MPIGRGGLDFAPPHFFDRGEVVLIHYPMSLSKTTIVITPAAIKAT
jgi:hypothetical protein